LAKALSQLGDVYEKIEQLIADQSHSDFFNFAELLKDYIGLLDLIKEAFYQRVKVYHNWQKAEESLKAKQEQKAKLEAASNKQDKIPTVLAEIRDVSIVEIYFKGLISTLNCLISSKWEAKVDKGKDEFEQISKTIRQEMKRFDKTRISEFKKTLTNYLQSLLDHQQAVSFYTS
jgi:sorting nexin-1/2